MKYYSEEHQWVEIEGGKARIGITKFAADELGELSYVELPSVGSVFKQGDWRKDRRSKHGTGAEAGACQRRRGGRGMDLHSVGCERG